MKNIILALFFVFISSCGDNKPVITGPEPSVIIEPDNPDPIPPPMVFNPGPMFYWEADQRGILVFAGTQANRDQITELYMRMAAQANGKIINFHVCAEVARWESTPWSDGPDLLNAAGEFIPKRNIENLERFLNVTADFNAFVTLDVICTIRGAPDSLLLPWARKVGETIAPYDHVSVHVSNEAWHPDSRLRSIGLVRRVRDKVREGGFRGLIGTDDNSGQRGDFIYNGDYVRLGFWTDFHPYRNPDPTLGDLRKMRDRNSGRLVISEPTAYSTTRTLQGMYIGGDELGRTNIRDCCTNNKQQILTYMRNTESLDAVWFFHSTNGLEWPGVVQSFEWLPGE